MSPFDVSVDGAIAGDMDALRAVTSWMMRKYAQDVRLNGGAGSSTLMAFINACGESVRIREVLGVPRSELPEAPPVRVEISAVEAAGRMGCSAEYVRRLVRRGRLPGRRVGHVWLIDAASVDKGNEESWQT